MPAMDTAETEQRAWLEGILEETGLTATELARRADLNPSTLTRFLSGKDNAGHTLTWRTIRKIENAIGRVKKTANMRNTGLAEGDATPYDADLATGYITNAVKAMIGSRNACNAWTIKTNDLLTIGLLPDDIVVVDLNESPRSGDIVCAQIYDSLRGNATTVFRLWEPPYLITGSTAKSNRRPVIVDDTHASLLGVVIGRISPRFVNSSAA